MSARALIVCAALAGCGDNADPPIPAAPVFANAYFPAVPRDALDLLFVVDNSPAFAPVYDQSFVAALPRFRAVLDQLDALPDLHVGVATSDLGVTGSLGRAQNTGGTSPAACHDAGDDGRFRTDGLHTGAPFLVEEAGAINADVPFAQAVTRLVESTGGSGCAFGQHFAAMRRALTNPANGAFLRADANLAIVFLGGDDDCSVRDPALFVADTTELGAFDTFRCTRAGLVCNEDIAAVGAKTGCRSNPDSTYVDDVAPFVDFVRGLKPDRRNVMASAILGDPGNVAVADLTFQGGTMPQPTLVQACMWPLSPSGGSVAGPGVRDAQLVADLGGVVESICQQDQGAQLTDLGHAVKRLVGDPCLADEPVGACAVTDEHADGTTTPLPACPADGDCYTLAADMRACPDTASHLRATITRTAAPLADTYVAVRCTPP